MSGVIGGLFHWGKLQVLFWLREEACLDNAGIQEEQKENNPHKNERKTEKSQVMKNQDGFSHGIWPCKGTSSASATAAKISGNKEFITDSLITDSRS